MKVALAVDLSDVYNWAPASCGPGEERTAYRLETVPSAGATRFRHLEVGAKSATLWTWDDGAARWKATAE